MPTDDERDPVEEIPPSDSTAADATADDVEEFGPGESGPDAFGSEAIGSETIDSGALGPDDEDDVDDEVEIDDPDALERATEQVSEAEFDDDLVEEPTNAELAQLTEGPDATAKAARDDDGDSGDGELVGVGAAKRRSASAKATSAETTDKKGRPEKKGAEKKGRATPKRDGSAPAHKRTGPVTFVKESVGELRKVVYPTGPQLLNYFVVVLIFVLFIIAFVSLLDLAFGWAILKIFS